VTSALSGAFNSAAFDRRAGFDNHLERGGEQAVLSPAANRHVEFETNLCRERQLEGIAAAKGRGAYRGRKPVIDAAEVRRLRTEERLGATAIARRLGIGRASVYRVLADRDGA
jgi:DNA invertase Pin-like site-specific DNA recombinase